MRICYRIATYADGSIRPFPLIDSYAPFWVRYYANNPLPSGNQLVALSLNVICVDSEGNKLHYYLGQPHRFDGPAFQLTNGDEVWYWFGNIHREEGPAVTRQIGIGRYFGFYDHGKFIAHDIEIDYGSDIDWLDSPELYLFGGFFI